MMQSYLGKDGKRHTISPTVLEKIKTRDKLCVYCHKELKELPGASGTPSDKATIEHMDDNSIITSEEWNVTMCCGSCNSSRGKKELPEWFKSKYCIDRDINEKKVAEVVKEYLVRTKFK